MEYNDEKFLSIEEYQLMAKAYTDALKQKGFKLVTSLSPNEAEVLSLIEKLYKAKALLLCLGGFLGTGRVYSLNERQIDKTLIIFDAQPFQQAKVKSRDKTKCFLEFLSNEFALINQLNLIAEQTSFEQEIKNMTTQRLNLLSEILSL